MIETNLRNIETAFLVIISKDRTPGLTCCQQCGATNFELPASHYAEYGVIKTAALLAVSLNPLLDANNFSYGSSSASLPKPIIIA